MKKHLRQELITEEELLSQLRQQGVQNPAELKRCYLEGNGHFSVIVGQSKKRSLKKSQSTTKAKRQVQLTLILHIHAMIDLYIIAIDQAVRSVELRMRNLFDKVGYLAGALELASFPIVHLVARLKTNRCR